MKRREENPYVKGRIPIVAFCSPSPAFGEYPNRINEKTFSYLKELGIDILLGHDEVFGEDEEKNAYVFKAMDYCEKYGIDYCVRMEIMHEFVAIENCSCNPQYKPFSRLTKGEKENLKNRFISQLGRCMNHMACIGIAFFDEPGTEMFDGIRFARDVFKSEYPDKLFYINHVSCLSDDKIYYYGQYGRGVKDVLAKTPAFPELSFENRLKRYGVFMDEFYEKTGDDDVFSADAYAVQNLGGLNKTVNRVLYDLPYFARKKAEEHGRHYWNFLQVSGGWDGYCRLPVYSELALQINVSLALGCKGLELFPVCFPKDFVGSSAFGSPIDIYGEKYDTFEPLKKAVSAVKSIREELACANYLGFTLSGKFTDVEKQGYSAIDALSLKDGEAIFTGSLSGIDLSELPEDISVKSDVQVAIGIFRKGNENLYLFVNNSIITDNNVNITLKGKQKVKIIYKDEVSEISEKEINKGLPAGECFLAIIKEQ
ncbi:MAG: hypothetical protein IJU84_05495 [Clostridia bacterium]|nr:hypothetical protein [Clostridia bacterium]